MDSKRPSNPSMSNQDARDFKRDLLTDSTLWEHWRSMEARVTAVADMAREARDRSADALAKWKWPQRIASGALGIAMAAAGYVWTYAYTSGVKAAEMHARDEQIKELRKSVERFSDDLRGAEIEISRMRGEFRAKER